MTNADRPFALGMFSPRERREPMEATPFLGVIEADQVTPLAELAQATGGWPGGPVPLTLHELLQDWDRGFAAIASALRTATHGDAQLPLSGLVARAPLPQARQIVCTGANYRQHVIDLVVAQGGGATTEGMSAEERRASAARRVDERAASGIPYAFPKLVTSLCGPLDDLVVPRDAQQLDWELELGVVIGRPAWRVPREAARDVVAGYLIVNDITRRELVYRDDLRSLGSDWLRAKSGPGFMPHGPWMVPAAFVPDPHRLELRLELNGQVMQAESTADMIFGIERQLEYVTSYARLLPGDILATGSPAGNGMHHGRFLQPGDVMRSSITGLGTQINRCIAEER